MVDVEVIDETGEPSLILEADVTTIVRETLSREGAIGEWAITVALTTDERLRALHADFMGVDEVTDVMTFPTDSSRGESVLGGDIVISIDRAMDQAADYDHTIHDEIRFLIVHGLLHLCGWTDETDGKRAAMLARQEELIAAIERDSAAH